MLSSDRSERTVQCFIALFLFCLGVRVDQTLIRPQCVRDMAGQLGVMRWTDLRYVHKLPGGGIAVDSNAPVYQWATNHYVRLHWNETSTLQVTLYAPPAYYPAAATE